MGGGSSNPVSAITTLNTIASNPNNPAAALSAASQAGSCMQSGTNSAALIAHCSSGVDCSATEAFGQASNTVDSIAGCAGMDV